MKKIYNYICAGLIGSSALNFVACNNEAFLDVDHYNILSEDYMFESEKNMETGLIGLYDTFYPTKSNVDEDDASMWGFKPQFMLANHPTLDTQASGWDAAYCTEQWTSTSSEFLTVWQGHYRAISRCNSFLAGLATMDVSLFTDGDDGKKQLEAEARAIRAWNYFNLVKNFGRVPMLEAGETYSNTPSKARPETEDESWALILTDLEYAANILEWIPRNTEYGRITKGFCLGYEAEALMYQAKYSDAKIILKQIMDSNTYSLIPCYSQLYDIDKAWTKEDLFCVVMYTDNGNNHSSVSGWSPTEDNYMWACYNTASMEYNGWGSLFISWECYNSFEAGDKRRQASMVALGETNPWTDQTIGANGAPHVKTGSEYMPNISSVKYWRTTCDYSTTINAPFTEHYLRYSNILLDYAECCFQSNTDESLGWDAIDQVRNRAWGNLEADNNLAATYPDYAIPMNTTRTTVPTAKTYYTELYASKGYSSVNLGIFACNWERRHENNAEFNLFYDMKRSGMLHEFLDKEYPANTGTAPGTSAAYDDWRTYRTFQVDDNKFLYPIPYDEILRNDAISAADQNPGY
jgi:hypothetical protein